MSSSLQWLWANANILHGGPEPTTTGRILDIIICRIFLLSGLFGPLKPLRNPSKPCSYLGLQSTQNNGPYRKYNGYMVHSFGYIG